MKPGTDRSVHEKLRGASAIAAVWVIGAAARLAEYPVWRSDDLLWWAGLPLLSTGDAYAWLTGADGVGRFAEWPLARAVHWLEWLTATETEWVAFWLPAILAPISGVLVTLLCMQWRRPLAGLVAGTFTVTCIGYLARTRLGFLDTDLVSLTTLTAMAWAWMVSARRLSSVPAQASRPLSPVGISVAAASTVAALAMALYPSGYPVAMAIVVAGAAVPLTRLPMREWGLSVSAVATMLLALHFGWFGWMAGLATLIAVQRFDCRPPAWLWAGMTFITLVLIGAFAQDVIAAAVRDVLGYALASSNEASGWSLPNPSGSILETEPVSLHEWALRLAGHPILLGLGIAGFTVLLFRKPESIAFMPLLGLGLASLTLGHRFAMYAAPAIGLGLGPGLALLVERRFQSRWTPATAQLLVLAAVLVVVAPRIVEMRPSVALSRGHAQALSELGAVKEGGTIWTWWDTGYATQYFSGLATVADGGSASRDRIYALALVLGARSPEAAAAIMESSQSATRDSAEMPKPGEPIQDPLAFLAGLDAKNAQDRVDSLRDPAQQCPAGSSNSYMVVSWSSLRQAGWIGRFADWRLDDGDPGFDPIATIEPPVRLHERDGVLDTPQGPVPLQSIDILDDGERFRRTWPRSVGAHAVINNMAGTGVLLDSRLYRMNLVQMLVSAPERDFHCFELVSDQAPAARVFRLKSASQ